MCESFSLFARQPSGYATEGSNHRGLVDPRLEVCYSHTRWSLALDSLTLIILTLALAPAPNPSPSPNPSPTPTLTVDRVPLLVLSYALLWSTAVSKTRRLELQTEAADLSLEAPGCPEASYSWLLGG